MTRRRARGDWRIPDAGGPAQSVSEAARRLKAAARALGFEPVGLAPPRLPEQELVRLEAFLAAGWQASMDWLARRPAERVDAAALLPEAGAVLMVGLAYPAEIGGAEPLVGPAQGAVAAYAQGPIDYHEVFAARLEALARFWRERLWPGAAARRVCDTAPLLERAFAVRAGLGFIGKNGLLIHPRRGSYLFLGGLIVDRPLPADEPAELPSCGRCTRCLEACPTEAFPAPYQLDAARCIAYLTIEHRGPYPEELRAGVGPHIFGCDVCQAVCPWNHKFAAPADSELEADPTRRQPPLLELTRRAQAGFKSLARGTAWYRSGKRGFLRNLATAMGNAGDARHTELLDELSEHPQTEVAEHARWARERLRARLGE